MNKKKHKPINRPNIIIISGETLHMTAPMQAYE